MTILEKHNIVYNKHLVFDLFFFLLTELYLPGK